jgi:hypothetical protein
MIIITDVTTHRYAGAVEIADDDQARATLRMSRAEWRGLRTLIVSANNFKKACEKNTQTDE